MGYSSQWCVRPLEVNKPEDRWYFLQAIEYLREESKDAWWALDLDGGSSGWYQWHDYEGDMKKMTEKFQFAVFVLEAIGEDCDEDGNWIEYWSNGKVQHEPAVITYGKYDEKKLKEAS